MKKASFINDFPSSISIVSILFTSFQLSYLTLIKLGYCTYWLFCLFHCEIYQCNDHKYQVTLSEFFSILSFSYIIYLFYYLIYLFCSERSSVQRMQWIFRFSRMTYLLGMMTTWMLSIYCRRRWHWISHPATYCSLLLARIFWKLLATSLRSVAASEVCLKSPVWLWLAEEVFSSSNASVKHRVCKPRFLF